MVRRLLIGLVGMLLVAAPVRAQDELVVVRVPSPDRSAPWMNAGLMRHGAGPWTWCSRVIGEGPLMEGERITGTVSEMPEHTCEVRRTDGAPSTDLVVAGPTSFFDVRFDANLADQLAALGHPSTMWVGTQREGGWVQFGSAWLDDLPERFVGPGIEMHRTDIKRQVLAAIAAGRASQIGRADLFDPEIADRALRFAVAHNPVVALEGFPHLYAIPLCQPRSRGGEVRFQIVRTAYLRDPEVRVVMRTVIRHALLDLGAEPYERCAR